jgi:hypothetical protein
LFNEGGENTQGHEPVPSSGKHQLRISVFVAKMELFELITDLFPSTGRVFTVPSVEAPGGPAQGR